MNKKQNYIRAVEYLAWLIFRSQGLITYYLVDNYSPEHKKLWIVYFLSASYLILLSEKIKQPLIPYFYKKLFT